MSEQKRPEQTSVRLSHDELERVLDDMDDASDPRPHSRREYERFRYRVLPVLIELQNKDEPAPRAFLIQTRNISAGGVSFLHGTFVHNDTKCVARLACPDGATDTVVGRVVNCRFIKGRVHEVSVRFESLIDPARYCSEAVRHRVLLVIPDGTLAKLTEVHLGRMRGQIERVADLATAITRLGTSAFDLVILADESGGTDAIRTVRRSGYRGTLGLITTERERTALQMIRAAGCDECIPSPPAPPDLERLFERCVTPAAAPIDGEDGSTLDRFVRILPEHIARLERSFRGHQLEVLAIEASHLGIAARSLGLKFITEAARALEDAVASEESLRAIGDRMNEVISLCRETG